MTPAAQHIHDLMDALHQFRATHTTGPIQGGRCGCAICRWADAALLSAQNWLEHERQQAEASHRFNIVGR